ncbi:hypothetical protein PAPHI01_1136 [Pancytospora philotis]|nr:hypothetical protein PAPHI01_1136 [Pancytospora philotis]
MQLLPMILPLTGYFACAQLSFDHAVSAVERWHTMPGATEVGVRIDGPLNILRAHPLTSDDMADFLSEYHGADSNNPRAPAETPANNGRFEVMRDERAKTQRAYEYIKRLLFPEGDGADSTLSDQPTPLCNYLRKQLSLDEQAHFFAIMLLIVNGHQPIIDYRRGSMVIAVTAIPQDDSGLLDGSVDSYPVSLNLNFETHEGADGEADMLKVRRIIEFLMFFHSTYSQEFGRYYLNSPLFLIHSYICKFADRRELVDRIFVYFYELLGHIHTGDKLKTVRERYFTTDEGEFAANTEVCKKLRQIHASNILISGLNP